MPATRSRVGSKGSSRIANFPMRSVQTRPCRSSKTVASMAHMKMVNPRNGTRWQTCRSRLLSSPKVTYHRFIPQTSPLHPTPFLPAFPRLLPTVVNALVQPPSLVASGIPFTTPLHTLAYRNASPPFVASKRTFTSLVSKVKAKVQEFEQTRYAKIFPLFFSSTLFSLAHGPAPPSRLRGPRGPQHFRCFHTFISFYSLLCQHLTGIPPTPLPLALALAQATQATLLSPLRLR